MIAAGALDLATGELLFAREALLAMRALEFEFAHDEQGLAGKHRFSKPVYFRCRSGARTAELFLFGIEIEWRGSRACNVIVTGL